MRKTTLPGVLLLLLVLPGAPGTAEEDPLPLVLPHTPERWLVLPPVDHRARRPFNPDAVYERHLLDLRSGPPREGDLLRGERGRQVAWKTVTADADGRVSAPLAYAYTRVESPVRQIVLARLEGGGAVFVNGVPTVGDVYGSGFGGLPVVFEQGPNEVYVRGARGTFKLTFERPPAPVFLAGWSRTLPDLPAGGTLDAPAGVFVVNATETAIPSVTLDLHGPDWLDNPDAKPVGPLAPLSLLQARTHVRTRAGRTAPGDPGPVDARLGLLDASGTRLHETPLPLHVRAPGRPSCVRSSRPSTTPCRCSVFAGRPSIPRRSRRDWC